MLVDPVIGFINNLFSFSLFQPSLTLQFQTIRNSVPFNDDFCHIKRDIDARRGIPPPASCGAAFADFDRDGNLDMIVMTSHGRSLLLRNGGGNRNHWLAAHLVGTRSNRSGCGAKVFLEAGGKRQMREYGAGGSYLSQSAPEAWFGLSGLDHVEKIEVQWLGGKSQIIENSHIHQILPSRRGDFAGAPLMSFRAQRGICFSLPE
jgi:ASPIC and UnbV